METEVKEPAVSYEKRYVTAEEYLAMEETAGVKHEYYDGEILQWRALPYRIIVLL